MALDAARQLTRVSAVASADACPPSSPSSGNSSILLSSEMSLSLHTLSRLVSPSSLLLRRQLSVSLAASQKSSSDPIQQLFVEKVREYATKKSSAGGKLVDADANTEASLKKELEKVAVQYGAKAGTDMTKFPNVDFVEPALENVDIK